MKYIPYELQDVGIAESKNLFRVISTFAGGGGSSTGYRLAGGHILAINEFVEEARNTYHANFPHTLIIPDDIKKLSGKDFLSMIKEKSFLVLILFMNLQYCEVYVCYFKFLTI